MISGTVCYLLQVSWPFSVWRLPWNNEKECWHKNSSLHHSWVQTSQGFIWLHSNKPLLCSLHQEQSWKANKGSKRLSVRCGHRHDMYATWNPSEFYTLTRMHKVYLWLILIQVNERTDILNVSFIADMPRDLLPDQVRFKHNLTQQPSLIQFPIRPWGLQGVLEYFKQVYGNPPIYIHENGLCFYPSPSLNSHTLSSLS